MNVILLMNCVIYIHQSEFLDKGCLIRSQGEGYTSLRSVYGVRRLITSNYRVRGLITSDYGVRDLMTTDYRMRGLITSDYGVRGLK